MRFLLSIVAVIGLCVCFGAMTGCEEKGPMEKAGESMDDAAESAGDAMKDAGEAVEDATDDG